MFTVKYYMHMHVLEGVFRTGCIARDIVFALLSSSLKLPDEALSLRFFCFLIFGGDRISGTPVASSF